MIMASDASYAPADERVGTTRRYELEKSVTRCDAARRRAITNALRFVNR